jgi:hypothetical protein
MWRENIGGGDDQVELVWMGALSGAKQSTMRCDEVASLKCAGPDPNHGLLQASKGWMEETRRISLAGWGKVELGTVHTEEREQARTGGEVTSGGGGGRACAKVCCAKGFAVTAWLMMADVGCGLSA